MPNRAMPLTVTVLSSTGRLGAQLAVSVEHRYRDVRQDAHSREEDQRGVHTRITWALRCG
jgi:hypothetical protein